MKNDHDEAKGTDCPCPTCVELADVHNAAMGDGWSLVDLARWVSA